MHRTVNPFVVPADVAAKVDEIMSASQARFGRDLFRMEEPTEAEKAAEAEKQKAAEAEKAKESKGADSGNATDAQGNDLGYPKDTPVRDMSVEQEAAYWKHNSRRHEGTWKGIAGDRTPDQVKADLAELAELRKAKLTPAEQTVEAAREEGRQEAIKGERARTAESIFRATLEDGGLEGDELDEIVANFRVEAYITDSGVDTTKLRTFAKRFTPDTGTQRQRRDPDYGAGRRRERHVSGGKGAAGKAEAERRFPKQS